MPSPLQEYTAMLANEGRMPSNATYDQTENALGSAVTAGAVGLNATLPIVQNNLQYAEGFNRVADATQKAGNALGIYSGYKSALGLTDPDRGSDAFSNTLSPGNMLSTGLQYASYLNPVTGTLQGLNSLTQDDENPYGTIPGVSKFNEYVGEAGNRINATGPGQAIMGTLGNIYDRTLGPVMDSTPGRLLHATASLPVSTLHSGFNVLKEAGEWVDRTLFGNYLPGLANEKKPDTMVFNNPVEPLLQNFDQFGNIIENNVYSEPLEPLEPIEPSEMNDDWAIEELNNLMSTIDATAEVVTDSVNINEPAVGASYPNLEMDDFQVEASEVNQAYTDALADQAREKSDRFVDDPNNVSGTGLGYAYVPDGFVFDPDVGVKLSPGFESASPDTNDYSDLSAQDRQLMQSAINSANKIKQNKIFLDPTRKNHVLNQATLNEIDVLAYNHKMAMKYGGYPALWEHKFRANNPTPKLGDYFLFNGTNVERQTGRPYNPNDSTSFWQQDISRQVQDAIDRNYTENFNYVDPGSGSMIA